MDLIRLLMNQVSGTGVKQISQQIGADEGTTAQAVNAAIPLLVSALAKNASNPNGAESLHNALQQHDGGILDDVAGYLGAGGNTADGGAILGHILGNRQSTVQNALSQKTGLDAASIGRILMMLAPMIMGALGKAQNKNGFDPGSLGGYLNGQQRQAEEAAPDLMGMLGNLLDANHDGSVLDDLGNIAGKFLRDK